MSERCCVSEVYLLYQVPEENSLLSQGIVNQALGEEDHSMGKIVLRKPRYHTLFLHIRTTCYVDDQIPQVLPVPACEHTTSKQFQSYSSQRFAVVALTREAHACKTPGVHKGGRGHF